MRCYFMKNGHITAIEFLDQTIGADSQISEARILYERVGIPAGADGFEIWNGKQFVYRFAAERRRSKRP
jgi:hypothetical protein